MTISFLHAEALQLHTRGKKAGVERKHVTAFLII